MQYIEVFFQNQILLWYFNLCINSKSKINFIIIYNNYYLSNKFSFYPQGYWFIQKKKFVAKLTLPIFLSLIITIYSIYVSYEMT